MIEYLLFAHNHSVPDLMDKPQGDNSKELDEATAQLQAVQTALLELQQRNDEQKALVAAQKKAEQAAKEALEASITAQNNADTALENQKVAEAKVRAAEAEAEAAVNELKRQEEEHKSKLEALDHKAHDQSLGIVARNKASNEHSQLKGTDPLPLRKAKITAEAALHRVEAERKLAEAATEKCTQASKKAADAKAEAEVRKDEAEKAARESEELAAQIEAQVADTIQKFETAKALVEEMKKKSGSRQGSIWWLSRDLQEAGKYMPNKAGRFE